MFRATDLLVVVFAGLVALAVSYERQSAHEQQLRAELAAMEARIAARIDQKSTADAPVAPANALSDPTSAAPAPTEAREARAETRTETLAAARDDEGQDGTDSEDVAVASPEMPPKAPEPNAPSHPLLGSWRCSFRSGEVSYPPMACEIRKKNGTYTLEKTQGSQRIKGTLALDGDSRFTFQGMFFCPYGACDSQVRGVFTRKSKDHWVGTLFDGEEIVVTMRRAS